MKRKGSDFIFLGPVKYQKSELRTILPFQNRTKNIIQVTDWFLDNMEITNTIREKYLLNTGDTPFTYEDYDTFAKSLNSTNRYYNLVLSTQMFGSGKTRFGEEYITQLNYLLTN